MGNAVGTRSHVRDVDPGVDKATRVNTRRNSAFTSHTSSILHAHSPLAHPPNPAAHHLASNMIVVPPTHLLPSNPYPSHPSPSAPPVHPAPHPAPPLLLTRPDPPADPPLPPRAVRQRPVDESADRVAQTKRRQRHVSADIAFSRSMSASSSLPHDARSSRSNSSSVAHPSSADARLVREGQHAHPHPRLQDRDDPNSLKLQQHRLSSHIASVNQHLLNVNSIHNDLTSDSNHSLSSDGNADHSANPTSPNNNDSQRSLTLSPIMAPMSNNNSSSPSTHRAISPTDRQHRNSPNPRDYHLYRTETPPRVDKPPRARKVVSFNENVHIVTYPYESSVDSQSSNSDTFTSAFAPPTSTSSGRRRGRSMFKLLSRASSHNTSEDYDDEYMSHHMAAPDPTPADIQYQHHSHLQHHQQQPTHLGEQDYENYYEFQFTTQNSSDVMYNATPSSSYHHQHQHEHVRQSQDHPQPREYQEYAASATPVNPSHSNNDVHTPNSSSFPQSSSFKSEIFVDANDDIVYPNSTTSNSNNNNMSLAEGNSHSHQNQQQPQQPTSSQLDVLSSKFNSIEGAVPDDFDYEQRRDDDNIDTLSLSDAHPSRDGIDEPLAIVDQLLASSKDNPTDSRATSSFDIAPLVQRLKRVDELDAMKNSKSTTVTKGHLKHIAEEQADDHEEEDDDEYEDEQDIIHQNDADQCLHISEHYTSEQPLNEDGETMQDTELKQSSDEITNASALPVPKLSNSHSGDTTVENEASDEDLEQNLTREHNSGDFDAVKDKGQPPSNATHAEASKEPSIFEKGSDLHDTFAEFATVMDKEDDDGRMEDTEDEDGDNTMQTVTDMQDEEGPVVEGENVQEKQDVSVTKNNSEITKGRDEDTNEEDDEVGELTTLIKEPSFHEPTERPKSSSAVIPSFRHEDRELPSLGGMKRSTSLKVDIISNHSIGSSTVLEAHPMIPTTASSSSSSVNEAVIHLESLKRSVIYEENKLSTNSSSSNYNIRRQRKSTRTLAQQMLSTGTSSTTSTASINQPPPPVHHRGNDDEREGIDTSSDIEEGNDDDDEEDDDDEDSYSDPNLDDVRINSPLQASANAAGQGDEFSVHLPSQSFSPVVAGVYYGPSSPSLVDQLNSHHSNSRRHSHHQVSKSAHLAGHAVMSPTSTSTNSIGMGTSSHKQQGTYPEFNILNRNDVDLLRPMSSPKGSGNSNDGGARNGSAASNQAKRNLHDSDKLFNIHSNNFNRSSSVSSIKHNNNTLNPSAGNHDNGGPSGLHSSNSSSSIRRKGIRKESGKIHGRKTNLRNRNMNAAELNNGKSAAVSEVLLHEWTSSTPVEPNVEMEDSAPDSSSSSIHMAEEQQHQHHLLHQQQQSRLMNNEWKAAGNRRSVQLKSPSEDSSHQLLRMAKSRSEVIRKRSLHRDEHADDDNDDMNGNVYSNKLGDLWNHKNHVNTENSKSNESGHHPSHSQINLNKNANNIEANNAVNGSGSRGSPIDARRESANKYSRDMDRSSPSMSVPQQQQQQTLEHRSDSLRKPVKRQSLQLNAKRIERRRGASDYNIGLSSSGMASSNGHAAHNSHHHRHHSRDDKRMYENRLRNEHDSQQNISTKVKDFSASTAPTADDGGGIDALMKGEDKGFVAALPSGYAADPKLQDFQISVDRKSFSEVGYRNAPAAHSLAEGEYRLQRAEFSDGSNQHAKHNHEDPVGIRRKASSGTRRIRLNNNSNHNHNHSNQNQAAYNQQQQQHQHQHQQQDDEARATGSRQGAELGMGMGLGLGTSSGGGASSSGNSSGNGSGNDPAMRDVRGMVGRLVSGMHLAKKLVTPN